MHFLLLLDCLLKTTRPLYFDEYFCLRLTSSIEMYGLNAESQTGHKVLREGYKVVLALFTRFVDNNKKNTTGAANT